MIYADDSIHDAIEKLAFIGSASKPLHEMSNKEIKRHRRNWEEERKTPETKIVRGVGQGVAGAIGAVGGAGLGFSSAPEIRLMEEEAALSKARHKHKDFGGSYHDPEGKRLQKVKFLEKRVADLQKAFGKSRVGTGARTIAGGVAGAAALGGGIHGLTRLGDHLGRRRLRREEKRRGIPKGSWKKASVNGTDGIHEGIEKFANVQRVKRFLMQGLSLDAAIEKAYPKMTPFNRQQMAQQLKRTLQHL
jgi:hypothetical protein